MLEIYIHTLLRPLLPFEKGLKQGSTVDGHPFPRTIRRRDSQEALAYRVRFLTWSRMGGKLAGWLVAAFKQLSRG